MTPPGWWMITGAVALNGGDDGDEPAREFCFVFACGGAVVRLTLQGRDTTAADWAALLTPAGGEVVLDDSAVVSSDGQEVKFWVLKAGGDASVEVAAVASVEAIRDAIDKVCAEFG